jgi:hypothetical protein
MFEVKQFNQEHPKLTHSHESKEGRGLLHFDHEQEICSEWILACEGIQEDTEQEIMPFDLRGSK